MNVYLTGDTHGRFERIACFCRDNRTTREDVLIILGDAGVNYYLNHRDERLKQYIATMPITLLCIHGNHEARPTAALGYEPVERFGGTVMAQREYPNLLFALDGEVYELGGRSCIAIGGAYSIDKHYRAAVARHRVTLKVREHDEVVVIGKVRANVVLREVRPAGHGQGHGAILVHDIHRGERGVAVILSHLVVHGRVGA